MMPLQPLCNVDGDIIYRISDACVCCFGDRYAVVMERVETAHSFIGPFLT